jgi:hypothetical protein
MKRTLFVSSFVAACAALWGCPIYPDNSDHRVCNASGCYDCPSDTYGGACAPWQCNSSYDCPNGYYCDGNSACVAGSPPTFDAGQGFDCSQMGCPQGEVCRFSNQQWQCVSLGGDDGGDDASSAGDDSGAQIGCNSNSDCAASEKCVEGTCTAAADLCFDEIQCGASQRCVDGLCTTTCDQTHACPTGYGCDTQRGVCRVNVSPCTINNPTCPGGTLCVEDHCVAPCATTNNPCAAGLTCVNGGCIQNEAPAPAVCTTEGVQAQCAPGNLCVHHVCYQSCAMDAGSSTCTTDPYTQCKAVTTQSGTYDVCGSALNLGGVCDLTRGIACAQSSAVCMDGFCN